MKFYTSVEQAGNRLLVRGYENGNRYSVRVPFNPTLYLPTKNYSEWRTLEGDCVEPHKFGSITEAREFIKNYKEVDDFDIYGNSRFLYQYIAEQHPEEELKLTVRKSVYSPLTSRPQQKTVSLILSLPIRRSSPSPLRTVSLVGLLCSEREHSITRSMVDYMHFRSEESMLGAFLDYWQENFPDVITGWNVQLFDMPYIHNRIERILGEKFVKLLSPWKLVSRREIYIKGRKQLKTLTPLVFHV